MIMPSTLFLICNHFCKEKKTMGYCLHIGKYDRHASYNGSRVFRKILGQENWVSHESKICPFKAGQVLALIERYLELNPEYKWKDAMKKEMDDLHQSGACYMHELEEKHMAYTLRLEAYYIKELIAEIKQEGPEAIIRGSCF